MILFIALTCIIATLFLPSLLIMNLQSGSNVSMKKFSVSTANQDNRLTNLSWYQKTNDETYLYAAMSDLNYKMDYTLIARIARHFEEGAKKYDENNWRKGIPCKCYIDSAVRHYFKWILKETDENHEVAFYWNVMCCIWTHENIPEMQSYKKEVD